MSDSDVAARGLGIRDVSDSDVAARGLGISVVERLWCARKLDTHIHR